MLAGAFKECLATRNDVGVIKRKKGQSFLSINFFFYILMETISSKKKYIYYYNSWYGIWTLITWPTQPWLSFFPLSPFCGLTENFRHFHNANNVPLLIHHWAVIIRSITVRCSEWSNIRDQWELMSCPKYLRVGVQNTENQSVRVQTILATAFSSSLIKPEIMLCN